MLGSAARMAAREGMAWLSLVVTGTTALLMVAAMVFTQALFGAGNTRFVMWVEFTLHFTCLVPLAWIFGLTAGWGIMGIWGAAVVYTVMLALIMGWKFNEGRWKEIRI